MGGYGLSLMRVEPIMYKERGGCVSHPYAMQFTRRQTTITACLFPFPFQSIIPFILTETTFMG